MALSENEHHVIPRSRGGADGPENVKRVSVRWHKALHAFFGNDLTHEKIMRVLALDRILVERETEECIRDVVHDILNRKQMYHPGATRKPLEGETIKAIQHHVAEFILFGAERTHEKIYRILEWDDRVVPREESRRIFDTVAELEESGGFYVENPGRVMVPMHLKVPLSMYPDPQPNLMLAPQEAV